MTSKQIIGWQYKVTIGDRDIVETMHEELSAEAIDYIARIEEAGKELYTKKELQEESIGYAQDVLMELYNTIKANEKILNIKDVLKMINEKFKELEKEEDKQC